MTRDFRVVEWDGGWKKINEICVTFAVRKQRRDFNRGFFLLVQVAKLRLSAPRPILTLRLRCVAKNPYL